MMTEKYPTWLIGHVKEWAEKRLPTVTLCSAAGNELLEVWYYGNLLTVKGMNTTSHTAASMIFGTSAASIQTLSRS